MTEKEKAFRAALSIVVGASMILLAVWNGNFTSDAIVVSLWPWREVAIRVGAAILLLIAVIAAWIGTRAFPFRPVQRGVVAFLASYVLCVLAEWCAWVMIDRFMSPEVEFWPKFILMFAGFEYGLLGSLLFTFPITGLAAALMTLGCGRRKLTASASIAKPGR